MKTLRTFADRFSLVLPGDNFVLISMALLIGLLSGLANIFFRSAIVFVHEWVFERGSELLHVGSAWYTRLPLPLIPMTGVALLVLLARKYPGEVTGYGFPAFLERVNILDAKFRGRNIILKTLGPALTIGTGGSAGIEGPVAQIGGTVGSKLGRMFRVSSNRMKVFIAAGSAGAIAASFNAPIAGTLFAVEIVLLGNFELASFSAIIVSAGIATVVGRAYYGEDAVFSVRLYDMVSPYELVLYMGLGLVVGILAVLYIRVFYNVRERFNAMERVPVMGRPFVGAFIVGMIGIFFPEVFGDGYEQIEAAVGGRLPWALMLILVFLKIVATSVTLGSGGAGGVFAPALFIGAMIGGAYGVGVNTLFPGMTAHHGAYATVGIGSFLAATTHAPLTAIFLLFEMTGNYRIIVPIMLAAVIGVMTARKLYPDSIDTVELSRKGINLHGGRASALMSSIRVGQVMEKDYKSVPETANLTEVIQTLLDGNSMYLPVVSDKDKLMGVISLQDVKGVLYEEQICRIVTAGQIATEDPVTLTPNDNLGTALRLFSAKDIGVIPVIDPPAGGKLVGVVRRGRVLATYDQEVLRRARVG